MPSSADKVPAQFTPGVLELVPGPDGCVLVVNGRSQRFASFDDAVRGAAAVAFTPGRSPAEWAVVVRDGDQPDSPAGEKRRGHARHR